MVTRASLPCLLLLACLVSVLGGDAGERCSEDGGSCTAETAHDTSGLLQTRGRRQTDKDRAAKKISIVKNKKAPPRRKPVEPLQAKHETQAECKEVLGIVRANKGISKGTAVWKYVCRDDIREHLSELQGGCLYLPKSEYVEALLKKVDRINPWNLLSMLESSFFPFEDGKCPTDDADKQVTGSDGALYTTCSDDPGFVAETGECTRVTLVGSAEQSNLKIYELDGMIGMEPVWASMINKEGRDAPTEASLAERSSEEANVTTQKVTKIPVEVVVCDPGDGSIDNVVSDEQIKDQIKVMNRHFKGKDKCAAPRVYSPHSEDTKFKFKLKKISRVTNQFCGGGDDCANHVAEMTSNVVPVEKGKIKILICDTSLLGMASFPGWPASERILLVNAGTLPKGSITNYNEGDTCTHEMGHYLGLYHTFQGGCGPPGDSVSDTDPESSPFFGCPTDPVTTCGGNVSDPVHNFMDYSDDRCMCSFTKGQKDRMFAQLAHHEPDLLR